MESFVHQVAGWIQRRSENLIAAMLGVMFAAFIVQIIFRYFFNLPTGWSTELSLVCWLWMVLWGTAFALKEKDEIRFDIFESYAGPRLRRVVGILVAAAAAGLYALSLPGSYRYVEFMKVERSSYLNVRLDWLYSVYVIFVVAVILRYLWNLWEGLRGVRDSAEQAGAEKAP